MCETTQTIANDPLVSSRVQLEECELQILCIKYETSASMILGKRVLDSCAIILLIGCTGSHCLCL